jgi:hypothetical protein
MSNTIQWERFCGRYIKAPWVKSGHRYATEGHICIRVPTTEVDTVELERPGTAVKALALPWTPTAEPWQPWPEPNYIIKDAECPECKGNGDRYRLKCAICNGTGKCKCSECGDEHDCSKCYGNGVLLGPDCPHCNGKGKCPQPVETMVGKHLIGYAINEAIMSLPGPIEWQDNPGGLVRFRFAGGEGLVCDRNPAVASTKGKE